MARDDTTNSFDDERLDDTNRADDTLADQGVDPDRVDRAQRQDLEEDIDDGM